MGIVAAFTDEIVSPLRIAAGQIRQLGEVQSEANDHLQKQAQDLVVSFQGLGSSAFVETIKKQGNFIGNIVSELNGTAWVFEKAANGIEDAGNIADLALGDGLFALAENVLGDPSISHERIMREGDSAIHSVVADMRQNLHKLLDDSGGFLGNLNPFHFHPLAALQDLGSTVGDLAHLGGDIFAMLDSVEQILGKWAGEVWMTSNWLTNQFQSLIFRVGDFVLGYSDMAGDAAILSDPNASDVEKTFASIGIEATALGDALLLIPGAEEGKVVEEGEAKGLAVGLKEAEKLAEDTVTRDLEHQVEATILHESERAIVLRINYSIAQDAENTVVHLEISVVEQSLKEDAAAEAEHAAAAEMGKGDESFVEKLKNIQQIGAKIGAGDFLTLHPILKQALQDSVQQIVDAISKKVLSGIYGEEAGKKLLESDVTKKIQEIAQDKISELYSKAVGGPIKQYLEGQIDESEMDAQVRAIANEICDRGV